MTHTPPAGDAPSASRRQFLKGSSTAILGGAMAGTLSISRSAYAAGDDQIKIALIGCGGRGTGAATQALTTKGNVKLVALGDAFRDRLESAYNGLKHFGDKLDVPDDRKFVGFDAYEKVISTDGVDLVILATPPGFRPIHLAAAVKAGKHVFMEKPVATDAPGVRSVLASAEEAKKKNLAIGVGLQRRHQKNYLETVKRLHDGAIGDIQYLRVYWNGAGVWVKPRQPNQTEMEYQMRNWYYFNWLCGDEICEQHIHNLDVGNWVKMGHPVKANGMGGRQVRVGKDYGEIFDHHTVEFEYADGSRMFSQCRHIPGCWSIVDEFAVGTKGTSHVANSIEAKGADPWKFKGESPNPYQLEHDDLFASIRNGTPLNEAEYGATSTMTSILGRMATYSGKVVNWDDAIKSEISLMPKDFSFDATPPVLPGPDGMYPCAVPGVTKVV
jgi:predicted dehydrogenase